MWRGALFLPDAPAATTLESLAPAGEHAATISSLAKRSRGFVYALPRTAKSYAFLFVAGDARAMDELVDRFTALPSAGDGVLVELSR